MRAHERPGRPNPYVAALAICGILTLAFGLVLLATAEDPQWIAYGPALTNIGALLAAGWLVAEAVLWRAADREKV